MANDLVRWSHPEDKGFYGDTETDTHDDNEQWDEPPDQPAHGENFGTHRMKKEGYSAEFADKQAKAARQRGDTTFAAVREEDAADHRQSRWDWGDLRTWVWIVGMCAGFLLFCLFVYLMPQARHNQADLPTVSRPGPPSTPPIRVY